MLSKNTISKLLFILAICLSSFAYSQNEGINWYFGQTAGLTFATAKPMVLNNSAMNSNNGSSSISNNKGRIILYTNGYLVWDSAHNVLSDTLRGLGGLQTALIVPHPDSSHLYYVFTVGSPTSVTDTGSFYSQINMNLRSGLGDFTKGKVNIPLVAPVCGKLTAIKHANRKDYWVLTQKYNTDTIYAYLINSSGVLNTPILSKTGNIIGTGNQGLGTLKVSPNGMKVCSVNSSDSAFIGDFDAFSGKISNIWWFEPTWGTGVEFSAKSRYLYTIGGPGGITMLYQLDLYSKTKQAFIKSRKTIDSVFYNPVLSMQLGPDGKIYIPERFLFYLHAIKNPDLEGNLAEPQRNYVYLGGKKCGTSLPNLVQSYYQKKTFIVKPNCSRDTVFFEITNTYDLDSVLWDFGDSLSGANNISKDIKNIYHVFKKAGLYKTKLIRYYKQYTDTVYETYLLNHSKPFLGKDTIICNSREIKLKSQGSYKLYKWSNDSVSPTISVKNSGKYYLFVTDYDGCTSSDTIVVNSGMVNANFSMSDSSYCLKNNSFKFKETTNFNGDFRKQSTWFFSDSSKIIDTIATKHFKTKGIYFVKLTSQSIKGCKDSMSKIITVHSQTSPEFNINNTIQCLNENSFTFTNMTKDTGKLNFLWNLNDKFLSYSENITDLVLRNDSTFKISLISNNLTNCKDTISKLITVLPSPKADFLWDFICSRTKTNFKFTGTIPLNPIVTAFHWDFDNSATSNLINPSCLLGIPGKKKVLLKITSNNGCFDSITKEITIMPQSKANFEIDDICENDSAIFKNHSIDATKYFWKFGDGNSSSTEVPIHFYKINGITRTFNVTLVAITTNGCNDSIIKSVTVSANPVSDFSFNKIGSKLILNAIQANNSQYIWKFGNVDSFTTTSSDFSFIITRPDQKNVCLKVTNLAGCNSQTCHDVTLNITTINQKKSFKVFPNPSKGNYTFEFEHPEMNFSVEIYNQIGNLVQFENVNSTLKSFTISINAPDGIYFVRIKNKEGCYIQKLMLIN